MINRFRAVLTLLMMLTFFHGAYGDSLTRTYGSASQATVKAPQEPVAVVQPAVPLAEPLDGDHRDAILGSLMPRMGLPDRLNHAINCFIAAQGNSALFVIAKYVKESSCGIEAVELIFDYYDVLNIPEARKLVVPLIDGLVKEINSQPKLKPCFRVFPITQDQIVIRIRVCPPDCGLSYPVLGNIASIQALDSVVSYGTLNSFSREIDYLRVESYQQAERLVARENVF